jgi:hypothetical protein
MKSRVTFFSIFYIIFFLFFSGCSASPEPVNLPIPFSVPLTADARVVVANGEPLSSSSLSFRQDITNSFGTVSWDASNSDGTHAAVVIYDSKSPQSLTQEGGVTSFTVPVTIFFDDQSFVKANEVKCFDLDYPIGAPNDPTILQTHGVCSGIVNEASALFRSSIGKTLDHRYVYQFKIVNGQRMFDRINLGPWIIQR